MTVWFEGTGEIECGIEEVKRSLENPAEHYLGVVRLMPGLTSVELVEQGDDHVLIRTNEGLMRRTNITTLVDADRAVIECDEEYQAGARVKTKTHFSDEFTTSDTGVRHRTVMSNLEAPGLLGFFYRKFGSAKMGTAFLSAHRAHLEG